MRRQRPRDLILAVGRQQSFGGERICSELERIAPGQNDFPSRKTIVAAPDVGGIAEGDPGAPGLHRRFERVDVRPTHLVGLLHLNREQCLANMLCCVAAIGADRNLRANPIPRA